MSSSETVNIIVKPIEPTRNPAMTKRWWGIEHTCDGVQREYPILHWADEPIVGAGPRQAFQCDACGDRYAFHPEPTTPPPSKNPGVA